MRYFSSMEIGGNDTINPEEINKNLNSQKLSKEKYFIPKNIIFIIFFLLKNILIKFKLFSQNLLTHYLKIE